MMIDAAVRDAVLLPLLVFVAVTALLRAALGRYMTPTPTQGREELAQRGVVARGARLRASGGFITPRGFAQRVEALLGSTGGSAGDLRAEVKDTGVNPLSQMDGMKMQMVNQFVYFGLFYAIQNALAGFLVVKLPFALTERFKQLTQQGIGVPALDTSFVSSGSWYMIAQYGISRVIELAGAGMPPPLPPPPPVRFGSPCLLPHRFAHTHVSPLHPSCRLPAAG